MKSYGVTIQMKPLQQYFHIVLFIKYVVLPFVWVCGPNSMVLPFKWNLFARTFAQYYLHLKII